MEISVFRVKPLVVSLLTLLALFGLSAQAAPFQGPLSQDTTWSGPIEMMGDVIVPSGKTLTISAGTTVTVAGSDATQSGSDTARVELILQGTAVLKIEGAAGQPVTFQPTANETWYGIRTSPASQLTAQHAVLKGMNAGLVLSNGGTFTQLQLVDNAVGVELLSGSATFTRTLFARNSASALITRGGSAHLDRCTVVQNDDKAIYSLGGSTQLLSSIVSHNKTNIVGYLTCPHSNVWPHGCSTGTNYIGANPLFVDPSAGNFELTSHSPSRNSGFQGVDMGAFPYVSTPTAGLQGVIHTNQTLSGTQLLVGDLTVPKGKTLTLQAGTVLQMAATDEMGSGQQRNMVELLVEGTLLVQGTASDPVTIEEGAKPFNLYQIRGSPTSSINVQHLVLKRVGGCFELENGGTLSHVKIFGNKCGVKLKGGTLQLSHALMDSVSSGLTVDGGKAYVDRSTFNENTHTLVSNAPDALQVTNSIVSRSSYALSGAAQSRVSITYSNFWDNFGGNGTGLHLYAGPPTGNISSNPLYADAAKGDYQLTSHSPSRGSGMNGTDMGAFPYAGVATSGLQGVLHKDQTLSGQVTLLGDLTVPKGKTLTLAPGTELTMSLGDSMASGDLRGRIELIVEGTLNILGTSDKVVTLTGSWSGIHARSGSAVEVSQAMLSGMSEGAILHGGRLRDVAFINNGNGVIQAGGTLELTRVHFDRTRRPNTTSVGIALEVTGGVANVDRCTFVRNQLAIRRPHTGGTLTIVSSVFALNDKAVENHYTNSTQTITYSSFWNNTTQNFGVSLGAGCISLNPEFMDVPTGNFRLKSSSPCIGTGANGVDMGAFPFSFGTLSKLEVSPVTGTVEVGESLTLTAQAYDAAGNPLSGQNFTWSTNGGTITADGVLTAACTPGPVVVTATTGTNSATASLTVQPGEVDTLQLTPPTVRLPPGGQQQFSAVAADRCGNALNPPSLWSALPAAGSISPAGLFVAGSAEGSFPDAVSVSVGNFTRSAKVDVQVVPVHSVTLNATNVTLAPGQTYSFTAEAKDASGNILSGQTVKWTVENGGGAIAPTGVFTAGTLAGTFTQTVRATVGAASATATVVVTPGPISVVTVTPGSATLAPGGTAQFNAVAQDAHGNAVADTISWSAQPTAGTISASGLFTAGNTAGSYPGAVTATAGSVVGKAHVTIQPGALAQLILSPASATLAIGEKVAFLATGKDAAGNTVAITPLYTVVAGGGTISAGVFTAGNQAGTFPNTVRVDANGLSATASITVVPGPVTSVTLNSSSVTLARGGQHTFLAQARDAGGNLVSGQPTSWNVVNGGGAITPGGLFTAGNTAGTFTQTVRGTVGGIHGYATVVVQPGSPAQLAIVPNLATVAPNGTVQFLAEATDSTGNRVAPGAVSWSAQPAAGTISATGLFTAGTQPGTFAQAVTATSGSLTATAQVTISQAALSKLELSPSAASLQAGKTVTFTVRGLDAFGNPVSVSPVFSVVAGGGTIDAQGQFTAGKTVGAFPKTVRAEALGLSAYADVAVTPGPTRSVEVLPAFAQVAAGQNRTFSAEPRDEFGNPVAGASVAWSTSPQAGSIDGQGVFTAGANNGDYAVIATVDGVSGHAQVRVVGGQTEQPTDGGSSEGGPADDGTGTPTPQPAEALTGSCGCQSGSDALPWSLLLIGLLALRQRSGFSSGKSLG